MSNKLYRVIPPPPKRGDRKRCLEEFDAGAKLTVYGSEVDPVEVEVLTDLTVEVDWFYSKVTGENYDRWFMAEIHWDTAEKVPSWPRRLWRQIFRDPGKRLPAMKVLNG